LPINPPLAEANSELNSITFGLAGLFKAELAWNIPAPEAPLAIPLMPAPNLMFVKLATALANFDGNSIAVMIPPVSTVKPKVSEAF
jgi:hypothetical protein